MADRIKVAGVILRSRDGRYLLVQECQVHVYGLWNLPAGHVDPGETLQQAAIREAFEETGFEVKLSSHEALLIDNSETDVTKYAFSAEIIGGELSFSETELLAAQWLTPSDIKQLDREGKLRSPWVVNAILKMEPA